MKRFPDSVVYRMEGETLLVVSFSGHKQPQNYCRKRLRDYKTHSFLADQSRPNAVEIPTSLWASTSQNRFPTNHTPPQKSAAGAFLVRRKKRASKTAFKPSDRAKETALALRNFRRVCVITATVTTIR